MFHIQGADTIVLTAPHGGDISPDSIADRVRATLAAEPVIATLGTWDVLALSSPQPASSAY